MYTKKIFRKFDEVEEKAVREAEALKHKSLKMLRLQGNESILDIGCSDGRSLIDIRANGHIGNLVGVDIDRTKLLKTCQDIKFQYKDANNLNFKSRTFDIILCFYPMITGVIHKKYSKFGIELSICTKSWIRILKDNGKLLFISSDWFADRIVEEFSCIKNSKSFKLYCVNNTSGVISILESQGGIFNLRHI